jgi:hypothetical protein
MHRNEAGAPHPALTCPRCNAPARPAPGVQSCAACHKAFSLHAGARHDPQVVPPPIDPRLPTIKVKSSGVVLMKQGAVAPEGVSEGTLDPVIGLVPIDKSGVLYSDVITIAIYRKIDLLRLIVACLIPAPLALLLIYWAIVIHPGFLVVGGPLALTAAYMVWRAAVVRGNFARVAGAYRMITIRFDSPLRRRRSFHDELLRRTGVPPSAIP